MPTNKKSDNTKSRLLNIKRESRSASLANRRKSTASVKSKQNRFMILSALLTRLLFLSHTAVAIWRVSLEYSTTVLYFLAIGIGCLLVEMVFTIGVRHGKEYKWFCPSVFFYLLSVVPCLWLLERTYLNNYSKVSVLQGGCNGSIVPMPTPLNETNFNTSRQDVARIKRELKLLNRSNIKANSSLPSTEERTTTTVTSSPTQSSYINVQMLYNPTDNRIDGPSAFAEARNKTTTVKSSLLVTSFTSPRVGTEDEATSQKLTEARITTAVQLNEVTVMDITQWGQNIFDAGKSAWLKADYILKQIDPETWLLSLHQVLLFVLVIGRWLLPKGTITRDQLSQLLLVFIGVGADILEFVTETIDHDTAIVRCNLVLHYMIYGVWSWSLLQFTLVLTASKSRKTRVGFSNDDRVTILKGMNKNSCCANSIFNNADLWGILVTLLLQDAPFLAFRLYIMIVYEQVHQMMVFFTGKNFLVVCLQIYRLVVLKLEQKPDKCDNDISQSELQPLKDTLRRLASETSNGELSKSVVERASFKKTNEGNITVKLQLIDESENEIK